MRMIDIKTLMSGNIVSYKGEDYVVDYINTRNDRLDIRQLQGHNYFEVWAVMVSPLPLSDIIFGSFGFNTTKDDYLQTETVYVFNGIKIYDHSNGVYSLYGYNSHKVYINNVHHLQNLYYQLTLNNLIYDNKIVTQNDTTSKQ